MADNKIRIGIGAIVLSAASLVTIASYEGYSSVAYHDSAGVPTIGYGETKGVTMKSKTTPDRALVQLLTSANRHADDIRQCIKVPLYQHEFDAYVSFTYNLGASTFCNSTLVKKLNGGKYREKVKGKWVDVLYPGKDYSGACAEIKRFVHGGGRVLPGLVKRREKEYQMCMGEVK